MEYWSSLKVDPRVVEKEITERSQKNTVCAILKLILKGFGISFWGSFWEPFWIPKQVRQNGAECDQVAAECGHDAEEFGVRQEYLLPPVQISYRNLAGYPAEKDLRRPWQLAKRLVRAD